MTHALRRCCFTLLLAGCLASSLYARQQTTPEFEPLPQPDTDPIRFEHLTTADGLSQSRIYSMVQDRKGFMWFSTQNGLNKYDGYDFTVYHHDPDDDTSIGGGGWTGELLEDTQGKLWVTTNRGGLSYLDPVTETFVHYRHDPADSTSLSYNFTWALLEDSQGVLWVGTYGGGLNRFDPATETFDRFQHDPADSTSLSHDRVLAILEDAQGVLWVGTYGGGLNRFDPATETFTRYRNDPNDPTSLSRDFVRALYEDRQGVLWVGTTRGLNRFDRVSETFTRFMHDPEDPTSLLSSWVNAIEEDNQGVLWIGMGGTGNSTASGLSRFDRATESFIHYQYDPRVSGSLNSNDVQSIFTDRQGMLWVGSLGLSRVDRSARGFGLYRTDGRDAHGLGWGSNGALYEDHTGVLWVRGGGLLNAFDRRTGTVTVYEHDPDDPQSIGPGGTRRVLEDHTGTLWLGNQWLNRFDRATGTFTHYKHDPDDPGSISPGIILSLYEDRQDGLWIGHAGDGGLDRLDPATGAIQHYRHDSQDSTSLGVGTIEAIYEDQSGVFWISVGNKLNRFDPATGLFKRFSEGEARFVITERPGEPGVLWISAWPRGLVRFDTRTEMRTRYTRQNSGLPNNKVYGILPDEAGHLWLGTEGGISRFNPDTDVFKNYDVDDGLQDIEFNTWSFHKSPSGEMFFGGIRGINYFFPDQIEDNTTAPEVVLTTFRLFNEVQRPGPDSPLSQPIADTEVVSLAHNQNHVSFDYVGLHYRNPEKNQYAYMLEGYDADWQDAETRRTASYTNLNPGTYTFRVKASNSDGVWNEEGASVRIVIAPPWWRTTWAYLLYVLLIVGGLFAVDRTQRRRLITRERERAMQREIEQKREIEKAHAELQETHQHLKTTQKQLVQSEKMASLGQLTAGIAHEIKNPLNFVNNFAQLSTELTADIADELDAHPDKTVAEIRADLDELLADLKINTEKIEEHGKRADGIVRAMMDHARGGEGERRAANVNTLLEEYVNLAYHGKRANVPDFNVTLEQDYYDAVGEVEMAPQEMGRVFINLLNNAFDAVHERALSQNGPYVPTVTVSTRRVGDQVEIRVADNGPGIPKDFREKIFDPFFTTKPTGSGTGLGLSLSYDIVTQGHGGTMTVESDAGEGAAFSILLPISDELGSRIF